MTSLRWNRKKWLKLTNFSVVTVLIELANQAEACLKIRESTIHKDRKVGSSTHGGYSNCESGVTRLVTTVWKSVQERGCEKSGKIVCFATYLKDELGITSIPLILFLVTGLTTFLLMLLGSTFFMISYSIPVLCCSYLCASGTVNVL